MTPAEKKVAGTLIKRLMGESPDNLIKIPTHGQVNTLYQPSYPCIAYKIIIPIAPDSNASTSVPQEEQ